MKKIIIFGTEPISLINFRGDLLKDLVKLGYQVIAISKKNLKNEKYHKLFFKKNKIKLIQININPYSVNLLNLIKSFLEFRYLIKTIKPDILISYTIIPNIFSGFSLKYLDLKCKFHPMITGSGIISSQSNFILSILSHFISLLLKVSLKQNHKIIFQNNHDKRLFYKKSLIKKKDKSKVILSSGVNTKFFFYKKFKQKKKNFLMMARLIHQKGIFEYIEAARIIKKKNPQINFYLAGEITSRFGSIEQKTIERWVSEGCINYLGFINYKDVRKFIIKSCCFVLPSYYPEGVPRSILEAMSVGRPIITTQTPGCKETVINNFNGFVIKPKSIDQLVFAMSKIINLSNNKINLMGVNSLKLVKKKFDVCKINTDLINFLKL